MYNTLWYLGSIVAAWTVYGTINYTGHSSWRVPVALQALMPFIQVLTVWTLPESPRWLCSKDRGEECMEILIKVSIAEGFEMCRPELTFFCQCSTMAMVAGMTLSSEPSTPRSKKQFN